jgi:hypothetical protein
MNKSENKKIEFIPKVFTINADGIGSYILLKIKNNINGNTLCIPSLIMDLGFDIGRCVSEHEKGFIEYNGKEAKLYLSDKNTVMENNVVAVLLVSDFILRFRRGISKRFSLDVFSLKEILRAKESRQLFLASRLAIPSLIIEEMGVMSFDFLRYSEESELLPMFLSTVRRNDFVKGFLDRDNSINCIDLILNRAA